MIYRIYQPAESIGPRPIWIINRINCPLFLVSIICFAKAKLIKHPRLSKQRKTWILVKSMKVEIPVSNEDTWSINKCHKSLIQFFDIIVQIVYQWIFHSRCSARIHNDRKFKFRKIFIPLTIERTFNNLWINSIELQNRTNTWCTSSWKDKYLISRWWTWMTDFKPRMCFDWTIRHLSLNQQLPIKYTFYLTLLFSCLLRKKSNATRLKVTRAVIHAWNRKKDSYEGYIIQICDAKSRGDDIWQGYNIDAKFIRFVFVDFWTKQENNFLWTIFFLYFILSRGTINNLSSESSTASALQSLR